MTKRDFFILLVKIFGLFSLITTLFTVLPQLINFVSYGEGYMSSAIIFATVLLLGGLFIMLVFKAPQVVSKLKLDQSFDEERIDFGNLNKEAIVKISLFIIGGIMIINNLSSFLLNAYSIFQFKVNNFGFLEGDDTFYFWLNLINIAIGYLLITNMNMVVKFFIKTSDSKPNQDSNQTE